MINPRDHATWDGSRSKRCSTPAGGGRGLAKRVSLRASFVSQQSASGILIFRDGCDSLRRF